jgi:hypothetical protein
MAADGGLNAHKRQPGDIPVVDKLLAASAVLHAQTKRHRSSVSFPLDLESGLWASPAIPGICDHRGQIGGIYPRAPPDQLSD